MVESLQPIGAFVVDPTTLVGRPVPSVLLAAAVLAAEGVSFVLVGSGALWLRGQSLPVGDVDAVIEPTEANLGRLRAALKSLVVGSQALPPASQLNSLDIVSVTTSYGKLDVLLERGRVDWDRLHARSSVLLVADVGVVVADVCDAWDLRSRFKV